MEHSKYKYWYSKLLRLYPVKYRQNYEEGMLQLFTDMYKEHISQDKSRFGFVLWVLKDSINGIIKENIKYMTTAFKINVTLAVATLGILYFVWWINGSELEDAWLYLSSGAVIIAAVPFSHMWKK